MNINGCAKEDIQLLSSLFGEIRKEITVDVIFESTERTEYIDSLCRITKEKFILDVQSDYIRLYCFHRRGMLYGLYEIAESDLRDGITEGYPLFKTRGYIEGFYGEPWSAQARDSMLSLMAKKRMNTLYYAPKDDCYHREKWRERYPAQELECLNLLALRARQLEVDFNYCIAPGLSICYSDSKDFTALTDKLEQLYDIGIRGFGLLFDDICNELTNECDKSKFSQLVDAQISLINRCREYLHKKDSEITLTVCPTLYHGIGNEYYISKLGRNTPPDVKLFWTGRDICSRELTVNEALVFFDSTRHAPLFWDNYPVNDCAMFREMHIGPLTGREASLYRFSEGIIFNCMEYAECSKIPLRCCADYLWNSEKYNPEASFSEAVERETGDRELMYFFDHMRVSCLRDENSALMSKAFSQPETLGEYVAHLERCKARLYLDTPLNNELRPWVEKFDIFCEIISLVASLAENFSGSEINESARIRLVSLAESYDKNPWLFARLNIKQELAELFGHNVL